MSYVVKGSGTGLGVIVGFEMFGVTDYVRRVADRVAALGHTVVVPDYYHRFGEGIALPATPEGREQGFALLNRVERPAIVEDTAAAIEELGTDRVAALGLSVGGHFLYHAATQLPIDTLVALYPGWLTGGPFPFTGPDPTLSHPLRASHAQIFTGADDHLVDAEALAAHVPVVVYPDTPHGYFCDERDSYRPGPAADTWERVTALFDRNVRR